MHDDTLMAFAQIAATFVGFAALVSALNRDRLGDYGFWRTACVRIRSFFHVYGIRSGSGGIRLRSAARRITLARVYVALLK